MRQLEGPLGWRLLVSSSNNILYNTHKLKCLRGIELTHSEEVRISYFPMTVLCSRMTIRMKPGMESIILTQISSI